ncbi:uncharacterized protein METZ01_LOCUS507746 [marine metagenome]|uniref:Uncharacterized protein n=1 Tax=marine metagenome TaxID=408172 RepID=A0A383EDB8_9ZZZZ
MFFIPCKIRLNVGESKKGFIEESPDKNRGFRGVTPVRFERTTNGLKGHCSTS